VTREAFTAALEEQLRIQGIVFSLAELLDFVESVWPLAADDPDPVIWAQRFIDSGRGSMYA